MLSSFSRHLELMDCFETDFLKLLYYDFPSYYKDNYHSYEYARLCTILEGEKNVAINKNDSFTYDKDKFVLLQPRSSVEMEITVPTKALVLELNNDLIKNVTEKISFDYNIDISQNNNLQLGNFDTSLKQGIIKILKTYDSCEKNKEFLIDLYVQEIVYELIKRKEFNNILVNNTNNPVYKAIEIMKNHYDEPICIKEIANSLNMSHSSFTTYFKEITGVTPNEYLKDIKLVKAKDMLKDSTVTEVAYDLGYNNISYFIKIFKDKYGMTPKKYKSYLNKSTQLN